MSSSRTAEVAKIVESNADKNEDGICETIFRGFVIFIGHLLMLIPIFWLSYTKVCEQYERLVHFRLGKVVRPAKGPGLFFFAPLVDDWKIVDLRIMTIDVPSQDMMTKDSVTVKVDAVVYFHVYDAVKATLTVEDHVKSTSLLGQTTLRSVVGEFELDEILQKREKINQRLRNILDESTQSWGVKVTTVEIKDVLLPVAMQRAMGSQAEAERDRRAKVISSEGELQASRALLQAANTMSQNHATLQLRYLQTLTQVAVDKPSTILFPVPISMSALLPNGRN